MADITITITDENGVILRSVEIYEDGSDSEFSNEIADEIIDNYDSAREINLINLDVDQVVAECDMRKERLEGVGLSDVGVGLIRFAYNEGVKANI